MTPRRLAVLALIIVVVVVVAYVARISSKTWQHRPAQTVAQPVPPNGAPPAPR